MLAGMQLGPIDCYSLLTFHRGWTLPTSSSKAWALLRTVCTANTNNYQSSNAVDLITRIGKRKRKLHPYLQMKLSLAFNHQLHKCLPCLCKHPDVSNNTDSSQTSPADSSPSRRISSLPLDTRYLTISSRHSAPAYRPGEDLSNAVCYNCR